MGLCPGQVDESEVITPTAMVKTFCFGELACRRDHDRRKYVSVLYPTFLPRDALLARYAMAVSVRPSVTSRRSTKAANP